MLLKQSGWFTLDAVSASLAQLLLSAWMIRVQGLDAYGHWALAIALLNFGALASLGVTPALSLRVHSVAAAGQSLRWLAAGVLIVLPAAVVVLAAAYLVGRVAFGFDVFDLGPGSERGTLLLALASHLGMNELIALAAATLRSAVSYAQAALCSLVFRLAGAVAVGAWCVVDATPERLLLVSLAVASLHGLVLLGLLARQRGAAASPERSIGERVRVLLRLARWQWIKSGGTLLFGAADRILIGHLLGPAVLAVYAVCLLLSDPLPRLASMLAQPLMLWAGRQREAQRPMFAHWRKFVLIETGILAVGLVACVLLPLVLPLWFGAAASDYAHAVPLAIVGSTLYALHMVVTYLLTGHDRNRGLAMSSLAGSVATLLAMAFVARDGADLGTLLMCRWIFGLALFAAWPALVRIARAPARAATTPH
jgi:O-antigen/teichoic acid export membrane protein